MHVPDDVAIDVIDRWVRQGRVRGILHELQCEDFRRGLARDVVFQIQRTPDDAATAVIQLHQGRQPHVRRNPLQSFPAKTVMHPRVGSMSPEAFEASRN